MTDDTRVNTASDGAFCPIPAIEVRRKWLASGKYKLTACGLEKFCRGCGDYWPADTEFFYSHATTKGGLWDWCKACYLERTSRGAAIQRRRRAAA